jgi:hypothetical protein
MKNLSFHFSNHWLKRGFGLIFVVFTIQSSGLSRDVINDMDMTVRLMNQKNHLTFQISIKNKTSTNLHVVFGDCPVTYVVQVKNKHFTYPEKQPFAPAQTCSLVLREVKLQPYRTGVVYTTGVYPDLERALLKAKGYYSGEFRFEFSIPKTKKSFQLIYKRQQR